MSLLDKIKTELGISDLSQDSYLQRQIDSFQAQLETQTGRKFGETLSYVEKGAQPVGQRRLIVYKYAPLTSINEIKVDGRVVDADNYEIELAQVGFIRFKDGVWPSTAWGRGDYINKSVYQEEYIYEVDYAGGETMPADVENALIDAVIGAYSRKGADKTIKSIKVGDASTTFGATSTPPSFDAAVQRYKVGGIF